MHRHGFAGLALALAGMLIAAPASADLIHLKSGKVLHGEVVKEDGKVIVVRVLSGEIKLKAADVDSIERQSPLEYKLELGRQLLQQRRFDRATPIFEEAYVANRQSSDARRMLANAYLAHGTYCYNLKRLREARDIFEKLVKIDPQGEFDGEETRRILAQLQEQEKEIEVVIRKAKSEALAENWSGALDIFERALELSPDVKTVVGAEMARCYVQRAQAFYKKRLTPNAAADLEAALTLNPRLGDTLEEFYTACALPGVLNKLANGNIAQAKTDLKRVLAFAPSNKGVLYVAGRLEEAAGQLTGAASLYAQAMRTRVANPTPEFTANLRGKLEKELGIEGDNWKINTALADSSAFTASSEGAAQQFETDNFLIYHHNAELAKRVGEAAELHRARIIAEMNLRDPWKGKAKVYLYRTQEEYSSRTGQPEWTGGYSRFMNNNGGVLYDPQIHSWQTSPRLLSSVLPHEIAHLVVNGNLTSIDLLPRALHEGYAILMEPKFRQDYFLDFLRVRLRSQHFIPLAELLTTRDYPADPEFFYAEGYAILHYLVEKKGLAEVVAVVRNATSSANTPTDLLRVAGVRSIEDLEADWKAWLLRGTKVVPLSNKATP